MQRKPQKPLNPLFKPQDRYYVNERGWWFYTVDMINGPYSSKADCVDACRTYIQKRDGVYSPAESRSTAETERGRLSASGSG